MSRAPAPERTVHALALGAWLRATRELAGWSEGELAARAGTSQPVVSRLEAGAKLPDAYLLGQLARAVGTDTAGLAAAVQRTEAAMLRAACALAGVQRGEWLELLRRLGEESAAALALAAARVWQPAHDNTAQAQRKGARRA